MIDAPPLMNHEALALLAELCARWHERAMIYEASRDEAVTRHDQCLMHGNMFSLHVCSCELEDIIQSIALADSATLTKDEEHT